MAVAAPALEQVVERRRPASHRRRARAPAATRPWTAQAVDWELERSAAAEREAAAGVAGPGAGSATPRRVARPPRRRATRPCSAAPVVSGLAGRARLEAPAAVAVLRAAQPRSGAPERRRVGARGAQREDREGGQVDLALDRAVLARRRRSSADQVAAGEAPRGRCPPPRARGSSARGRRPASAPARLRAQVGDRGARRSSRSSGLRPAASSPSIAQPVIAGLDGCPGAWRRSRRRRSGPARARRRRAPRAVAVDAAAGHGSTASSRSATGRPRAPSGASARRAPCELEAGRESARSSAPAPVRRRARSTKLPAAWATLNGSPRAESAR